MRGYLAGSPTGRRPRPGRQSIASSVAVHTARHRLRRPPRQAMPGCVGGSDRAVPAIWYACARLLHSVMESKSAAQAVEDIVRSLDTGPATGCQRSRKLCRTTDSGRTEPAAIPAALSNSRFLRKEKVHGAPHVPSVRPDRSATGHREKESGLQDGRVYPPCGRCYDR